ncbi:Rpn family recombination-promoting nuclease/putative transposase [Paenibacillus cymbidii]|uniref:Rpn family recombination-promoting nuclease/putative transposase n=1 Tax=Paenibacillus cymbidii TaxID=1639034 RepID=UPI001080DD5D|nr:Rpn family recombination-promoting nuclease/putative transposase [Paenibacillus cymbidii]
MKDMELEARMQEAEGADGIHQPHDKGYKYLLSSKKLFLELLRSFVSREWVEQIAESDLTALDKSFILPDFSEKEADLVYRLKTKEQDVIFYVLMEMQSTVDFQMPYRLLLYQVEIWRDIRNNTDPDAAARKSFKLPAIVPIVLYNGEAPWTANTTFRGGIAGDGRFGDELLDFSYLLIDVQRYSYWSSAPMRRN